MCIRDRCHADLEEYILILDEDIAVKDAVVAKEQTRWQKVLKDVGQGLDISFDAVSFSYPGRPETLKTINLDLSLIHI